MDSVLSRYRDSLRKDHLVPVGTDGLTIETGNGVDVPRMGMLHSAPTGSEAAFAVHPRGAWYDCGGGLVARRRGIGALEPDMPGYLVDDRLIAEK